MSTLRTIGLLDAERISDQVISLPDAAYRVSGAVRRRDGKHFSH
jgi:hypothetical protein